MGDRAVRTNGSWAARGRGRVPARWALATATLLAVVMCPVPPAGAGQAVPLPVDSPEAPLLAVLAGDGLVVQRLDGDGRTVVSATGERPAWSPDGRRLAWVEPREQGDELAVAEVVDGSLQAPSKHALPDVQGELSWSADGGAIAFAGGPSGGADRWEQLPDAVAIRVVDAATGARSTVSTPPEGGYDDRPRWAPVGDAIAFRRHREGLSPAVVVAHPGGAEDEITERLAHLRAVRWTPDGGRLVVTHQDAVELVDPSGTGRTTVLDAPARGVSPVDAAMAPDLRHVAVAAAPHDVFAPDASTALLVVDLATGSVRTLFDDPDLLEVAVAWTPSADAVAVSGFFDDSGCHCMLWETHVVALDGTSEKLEPRPDAGFDAGSYRAPDIRPPDTAAIGRAAGTSRVETAVAASQRAFDAAGTVVIARADAYPDALAGGPLAGGDGPVLLTGTDSLHPATAAEVERLGAERALLMGDATALGEVVAVELRTRGVVVERIAGPDRFATAAEAARTLATGAPVDHAYVVEGGNADPARGWPDAVAVSALAAATGRPIVLVERDRLPQATADLVRDLFPTRLTIVGGTAAVSAEVQAALGELGPAVDRIAGEDRYTTSAAVADVATTEVGDVERAWIASGANWPDALAAGPAAAATGDVLLLAPPDRWPVGNATRSWLESSEASTAVLVGGPDVLSPAIGNVAAAILAG